MQQGNEKEARRIAAQGSLEGSEGKSPAAAERRRVLPEAERKRPGSAANPQRDSVAASFIPLASAFGESSLITLRLLSPQSQRTALWGPRLEAHSARELGFSACSV